MKINKMTQNPIGTQKKVSMKKEIDTPKEQVTLGQPSENLGIMEQPLVSMKSN